jgi:hypothetical protein
MSKKMDAYGDGRGQKMNIRDRLKEYISRGKEIKRLDKVKKNQQASQGFLDITGVNGPEFEQWVNEIKLFSRRYLQSHPLYQDLDTACFKKSHREIMGVLQAIETDEEFSGNFAEVVLGDDIQESDSRLIMNNNGNRIFIVHGHDDEAKEKTARFIREIGCEPIILHEQPSGGKTVIEKIESNSDVSYAIILYTPCDEGKAIEDIEFRKRARQNVVFEHGYLIGKLGRDKVCALQKSDVETPGDISGVVYITMDDKGAWRYEVIDEMKALGYEVSKDSIK